MSERIWTPKLWLGLLVFVILVVLLHPGTQWRAQVLGLKLTGRLPSPSWSELSAGLAPQKHHPYLNLLCNELVRGLGTFKRYEECGCPILWNTPFGEVWSRFDDANGLELVLTEQSEGLYCYGDEVRIRGQDVVLDVGGHLGIFALSALRRGAGLVVIFEPDPNNIRCLKRTLGKQLAEKKVILVEAAAMECSGEVSFAGNDQNSESSKVESKGKLTVKAVTIDETMEALGIDRVDFIKMDIEGAERYALAGAVRTIAGSAPRMAICIYHLADDPRVIPNLILDAQPDYRVVKNDNIAFFYRPGVRP